MFKVSPTSLQTFIDTPNCVLEDLVFCDDHLQIINCMGIVWIHWVGCTETFWSLCIWWSIFYYAAFIGVLHPFKYSFHARIWNIL